MEYLQEWMNHFMVNELNYQNEFPTKLGKSASLPQLDNSTRINDSKSTLNP